MAVDRSSCGGRPSEASEKCSSLDDSAAEIWLDRSGRKGIVELAQVLSARILQLDALARRCQLVGHSKWMRKVFRQ